MVIQDISLSLTLLPPPPTAQFCVASLMFIRAALKLPSSPRLLFQIISDRVHVSF